MAGRRELTRLLDELEPDRIEVSDRATLRWTGAWARQRGVGSMMVSHESLAGLLGVWGMPKRDALADRLNRRTAETFDTIVCTTAFAAAEFRRLGVPNLVELPLGVDLDEFHPQRADPAVRARYVSGGVVWSEVIDNLPEGRYVIWRDPVTPLTEVVQLALPTTT